ncbi:LysR substrate-binding domain-containing protein [Salinarimonas rosea]|uniref:LysR substrate-binding domain-containing protein n=1 Tax=Salinarimonas rosea TaxID=552063 RepID=UPI00041564F4|nr:LysR substrate-binding domain-containing protein [Salinarimonas rosea]
MNFRQIEAFRAVMLCGTASRAAEMLRISQPAVSRHLAELEGSTRLTLFLREHGRLKPTAEAHALLEEVQRSFVGLERLRFAAENIRSFRGARLRIISLPALGHAFLPRVVGRFATEFPDVPILLQIRSSEYVREEVAAGNFDLGFAADEISKAGLDVRPFANAPAVCIMPKDHRLAGEDVIGPGMLADERFVTLASEDAARARFDAIFAREGAKPRVVCETQYSLTISSLVRHGVGLALVNPFSLDGLDLTDVAVRPFRPAVHFKSLLVRPPEAPTSRIVEVFLEAAERTRDDMAARGYLAQ